ncbi:probable gluconokinase [Rhinatrema bivittatum]|uniref:probable gluconokinase n=1 Tax=Rhinatrema bivittatum TaxID=194408 RepID=UPI001127C8FA|nr:probable gluconokinase [Rhinatrema bivittatum]
MVLVVVMGVSGSGKSTVGSLLANKLGWKFYDADDYHSKENKMKMAEGIPLTDQDRIPWLSELHRTIREGLSSENVVLACSALKQAYRNIISNGESTLLPNCGQRVKKEEFPSSRPLFVHLDGSMEVICQRLEGRKGHFMPSALLQSQFDTLEPPSAPEHFIIINVEKSVSEIVSEIVTMLK